MAATIYEKPYIGSIDQGTTSTRFIVFDKNLQQIVETSVELEAICKKPGWVEFNPGSIMSSVDSTIAEGAAKLGKMGLAVSDIKALGITCQRETIVVWNKDTGKPVYNAISWQDIRTSSTVDKLVSLTAGAGPSAYKKLCGLNISTYFSAVKLVWLLENSPEVKKCYDEDKLMFGTIDTWLLYNLTGGVNGGVYISDVTNASRTMLMDIRTLQWSNELIKFFDLKESLLPKIVSCSEKYGSIAYGPLKGIPLTGCMGDQQASLLGHMALNPGDCKNTYGTGVFMLCNTGKQPIFSSKGLLTTVAWKLGPGSEPVYAIEGSISIGGYAIKWLRDSLKIISNYQEADALVESVYNDDSEVFFVPAFSGLFSPYWDGAARGTIIGMTHNTTRSEIVKSGFEAMAYQTSDILDIMSECVGHKITSIIVDGGVTKSTIGVQIQSDILGIELKASKMPEVTALGSAIAAGLAVGIWKSPSELTRLEGCVYKPKLSGEKRKILLEKWKRALQRSMKWDVPLNV